MWRDRTNLYISYRQSYAHHPTKKTRFGPGPSHRRHGGYSDSAAGPGDDDTRGLLADNDDPYADDTAGFSPTGDAVIEMDHLPPRWADIGDEVNELLAEVARRSVDLDRLHQKHVLPGFDDDEAKRREEGQIETLTRDITRAFHDCHRAIQRVQNMVRDAQTGTGPGLSRSEEAIAKNIQVSLAARVQEASAAFRKKQSAYLKKLRAMSGVGTSSPLPGDRSNHFGGGGGGGSSNYAADPSLLESDADRSYSQSALLQQQQTTKRKTTSMNDAVIEQREREIEDIAQGIIDLSDLFRDLQTMVIDQGTMLDRIDYNVERMAVDVRAADRELVTADGYQKKTTKRKLILLLLLLIVGAIILLVIKPKRGWIGGSSSSTDQSSSGNGDEG